MPTEIFREDLDNITEAGRFFVALAERLEDSPRTVEMLQAGREDVELDVAELAHALRVPIPSEWRGASIRILPDDYEMVRTAERTTVVIDYPPVVISDQKVAERSFNKCVRVCKTVKGVTVCAEVCIKVSIGWDGIHGSVKATVTATF
jgi:hypothetical protein